MLVFQVANINYWTNLRPVHYHTVGSLCALGRPFTFDTPFRYLFLGCPGFRFSRLPLDRQLPKNQALFVVTFFQPALR